MKNELCHIIRLYKCKHCTLTYPNKITYISLTFAFIFLLIGGRWFSKILRNIWGWYVKILSIPYRGRWVVWKRPKTPLRNIKMAPYKEFVRDTFECVTCLLYVCIVASSKEGQKTTLFCGCNFGRPWPLLHKGSFGKISFNTG